MNKCAFYDFEFGILKIGYNGSAVTSLTRTDVRDTGGEHSVLSDLAFSQICEYLEGRRRVFDFPYELRGTAFQEKVWRALCCIPYGETRTYGQIAGAIGSPKASRAVGLANSKNPLMIFVPCHRVIGSEGSLTGYAGGLEMKAALLALERRELR